ncbi:biotin/lipoyl-containing protein [uncultured Megasphaera sp.]|uniref:biotin/lipoyl-containing protein n=1 Tax=uncultured Megasphaera sp. TaxID=165188 RepID=UPI00265A1345|nr:biotin/lipoyl-containing protein [uncultured Megasphaera sp.]
MKQFKITVNGKTYDVSVEEMNVSSPAAAPAPAAAPTPAPAAPSAPATPAAPAPAPKAPVSSAADTPAVYGPIPEGAIVVKAPMPGKISAIKAEVGASLTRGDVLLVLEAMKMQNDITATADGTLHEVRVAVGDNVKTGDILAVITK